MVWSIRIHMLVPFLCATGTKRDWRQSRCIYKAGDLPKSDILAFLAGNGARGLPAAHVAGGMLEGRRKNAECRMKSRRKA